MKKKINKWYIYFSCLLIAFMLFVSFGVTVNANSSSNLGDSFIYTDGYFYNEDYDLDLSINQPYVMNYWFIDTQTSPQTNITNPYFYVNESNPYTVFYNSIYFNYYYDSLYLNDTLYNNTIVGSFNEKMYNSFVCGYYSPFYIYSNDFDNNNHTLTFGGISLPVRVDIYYSISYLINPEPDSYEIYTDIDTFIYMDSLYTDDNININDGLVLDYIFNKETPYYVDNSLLRVNYIYYEFTIDWTDYIQGTSYYIDYTYPIMNTAKYQEFLNAPNVWDNYDISLNPVEIDFGQGLLTSVNSFLQFEILPNFTLFNLLLVIIAVPMLIYILKLFLGG